MGILLKQNGQKIQFDVKSPAQFINVLDGVRNSFSKLVSVKVELISELQTNRVMYELESSIHVIAFITSLCKVQTIMLPLSLNGTLQLSNDNYVRVTLVFDGDISDNNYSYELVKTYDKTDKPLLASVLTFNKRIDLDTSFYTMMLLLPDQVETFESTFTEYDEQGNEIVKNVFFTGDYLKSVKPVDMNFTPLLTAPKQNVTIVSKSSVVEQTIFLLTV